MAKAMLYFGAAPTWEETFRKVARTTTTQLQQVAQDIFDPDNTYLLIYK